MTTTPTERRLAIREELNYLYWSAYHAGHHDTVEGCYTDVFAVDRLTYHDDVVSECLSSGDMPTVEDAHNVYQACGLTPSELLAKLTKLRSERDELVGALRPFAKFGAAWIRMPAGKLPDDAPVYAIHGSTEYAAEITIGQLKEAHKVLSKHKPE